MSKAAIGKLADVLGMELSVKLATDGMSRIVEGSDERTVPLYDGVNVAFKPRVVSSWVNGSTYALVLHMRGDLYLFAAINEPSFRMAILDSKRMERDPARFFNRCKQWPEVAGVVKDAALAIYERRMPDTAWELSWSRQAA